MTGGHAVTVLIDDFIAVHDDALPADFCEQLIEQFKRSERPVPGRTGQGVDLAKKRSTDITMNLYPQWHPLLKRLLGYTDRWVREYLVGLRFPLIGALSPMVVDPAKDKPVALTVDNWEQLATKPVTDMLLARMYRYGDVNLQKYTAGEGGYFHWHSEIYPQGERCEPLHRVLLFMFYLNDVSEGGETEFYYQEKRIAPKRGRMVIAPAGFTHTHRGNTPVSNDKYIATSWVLFQRAEDLQGKSERVATR